MLGDLICKQDNIRNTNYSHPNTLHIILYLWSAVITFVSNTCFIAYETESTLHSLNGTEQSTLNVKKMTETKCLSEVS